MLRTLTALALAAAISAPAQAQTLWCHAAKTPDEVTICNNPALVDMDLKLNNLYSGYLAIASDAHRSQMIADEAAWARGRGACGSDVGCIAHAYLARFTYLRQHIVEECSPSRPTISLCYGNSQDFRVITDADVRLALRDAGREPPEERKEPDERNVTAPISIPLQKDGGIYVVPATINDTITLNFVVDSGASDVTIPVDVVTTLMRTGKIVASDFVGSKNYRLANGSQQSARVFVLRSVKVGNIVVTNVQASTEPVKGVLLLGQSFLRYFRSWRIDNSANGLVLELP
ncbi:MAG TPA: retroviral-like aspartic protease family protein [Xanthobacteraceae bacterium]